MVILIFLLDPVYAESRGQFKNLLKMTDTYEFKLADPAVCWTDFNEFTDKDCTKPGGENKEMPETGTVGVYAKDYYLADIYFSISSTLICVSSMCSATC